MSLTDKERIIGSAAKSQVYGLLIFHKVVNALCFVSYMYMLSLDFIVKIV